MKAELRSDKVVTIHVEWTIMRKPASKDTSGVTSSIRDIHLKPENPVRQDLLAALDGTNGSETEALLPRNPDGSLSKKSVLLKNVLPMFLKVTSQRGISVVPQLMMPLMQIKSECAGGSGCELVTM